MVSFSANRPYIQDYNKSYSEIMKTYYGYEEIVRKTYRPREPSTSGKRILEELEKKRAENTSSAQPQPPCLNSRKRQRRETSEEIMKRKELEKKRPKVTLNLTGPVDRLDPRTLMARKHTSNGTTELEDMHNKEQCKLKTSSCVGRIKKHKHKPLAKSIRNAHKGLETQFVGDGAQFLERLRREGEVNQMAESFSRKLKLEDEKISFTVPIDAQLTLSMSQRCGIKPMWPLFVRDPVETICELVKTKLRLT